ncbi:ribosomal protein S18 acetylase RimI-like enzyme [Hoeflea marina]|uniref:Ribosomal protein S18 acetylase RimI-like enzyme n=1 Tax=Hoeflea marina TaxID=274592 RepID=A0A317PE23_9HYPH|nr:GNAT family N-acetyltransferase [Hoeflea marina]PWV95393.1 ribosomal protein S18 acetylase RimI-like enzyme [Hoeflea marina]
MLCNLSSGPWTPAASVPHPLRYRRLRPADASAFAAHLHQLDPDARRDRFNGTTSDHWLDGYIERSLKAAIIVGAFDGRRLVAVAELHRGDAAANGEGETAFSVAAEWRRKGVGSALIRELLKQAETVGLGAMLVETGSNNLAMKALARRHGAEMRFSGNRSVGRIEVPHGLERAQARMTGDAVETTAATNPAKMGLRF